MSDGEEAPSSAPVDTALLSRIADRLRGDRRFTAIEQRPSALPTSVVCRFEDEFYPAEIAAARLEIAWYENDDFSLHYHERHEEQTFDHRWDRHPSSHNSRDHVHPGPDAPTPGRDADHPADWRDVLAMALGEIEERQPAFWDVE